MVKDQQDDRDSIVMDAGNMVVFVMGSNGGDSDDNDVRDQVSKKRKPNPHCMTTRSQRKKQAGSGSIRNPQESMYTTDEWEYFKSLSSQNRHAIAALEVHMRNHASTGIHVPLRFRILRSNMPDNIKAMAINKCNTLAYMHPGSGDYSKIIQWLELLEGIPFYKMNPMTTSHVDIPNALNAVKLRLDQTIYGHDEVKNEIMNFISQRLVNPYTSGRVLCLVGPPGIAKTHLVRCGISKALGLPFSMIALGGASDGSFLDGHGFTYEGSRPGIIVQELIRLRCSNPVLFFDELDKVSGNHRGNEITNILLHVTDQTQNDAFRDKYFADVPIDLSKVLIVFSCNDIDKVNRILRDRMLIINMKGYSKLDKLNIARSHLLPQLYSEFMLTEEDVYFSDDVLSYIIDNILEEDGVRTLKRALQCIIASINTQRLMNKDTFVLPTTISQKNVDTLLTISYKKDTSVVGHSMMYT